MQSILRVIRDALDESDYPWFLIFLMEVCTAQYLRAVLKAKRKCNVYVVFVPAKMTEWLQPMDTHCFTQYKQTW